jgi:hypothetical protein
MSQNLDVVKTNNYELSAFNATKHGILSCHTVLPWESTEEYSALLDSLQADFKPQTLIASHLIEEMAGVLWRKKRLKKAEQTIYIEQDKESFSSHDVKQKLAKEYTLLPLMRYEIHLDRKFERILSIYYKLKELEALPNKQI